MVAPRAVVFASAASSASARRVSCSEYASAAPCRSVEFDMNALWRPANATTSTPTRATSTSMRENVTRLSVAFAAASVSIVDALNKRRRPRSETTVFCMQHVIDAHAHSAP